MDVETLKAIPVDNFGHSSRVKGDGLETSRDSGRGLSS